MKYKTSRNVIKSILISFLLIFAYSCEKESVNINATETGDDNPVSKQYENDNLIIESSGFSNFQNRSSFQNLISSFNLESSFENFNSNINRDNVNLYGFVVDTANVKQIINDDYLSYTFSINRDEGRVGLYENLLIEVKNNEEKAYIVSYIPDQQWLTDAMNGVQTEFNGTVRLQEISTNDSNSNRSSSKRSGSCGSYYVYVDTQCPCIGHWPGQSCSCTTQPSSVRYTFDYPCTDEDDGYSEGPIGPRGGGGGGGSLPSPSDTVTSPTGISNSDGSVSDVQNIINDLNNILNDGDSFVIDYSLEPDEVANFDSVFDFESYLNNLNTEVTSISLIDSNQNTETYKFDFELDSFLNLNLRANVQIELPEPNTDECLEVIGVSSLIFGNTSIFQWNQIGEPDIDIQQDNDIVRINFQGTLTTGIKVEGWPFKVTRIYTIQVDFNYSNSNPISGNIISVD